MRVLEVCQENSWLRAGAPLADGIAELSRICVSPEPQFFAVYNNVLKLESFNRLAHAPAILDVMTMLIGEPALPHPTKIGRIIFPQNTAESIPPHQDYVHIQGTTETYTCWLPLGDCPYELGGLTVLVGSHKSGLGEYHFARGAGGIGIDINKLSGDGVTSDYQTGDALVFHSMTVHRALPNVTPDLLRLSADYRYQAASQPIAENFLLPSGGKIAWEEVYAGWQSKDLQYYWKNVELRSVPLDRQWYEQRDLEAFELARQGNEVARTALIRIIEIDPNPEKRKVAEDALRELEAKLRSKN